MNEKILRLLDKVEEVMENGPASWPGGPTEGAEVEALCQEIREDLG